MKIHMRCCPAHPLNTEALLTHCYCRSPKVATLGVLLDEYADLPLMLREREIQYSRELLEAIREQYAGQEAWRRKQQAGLGAL